MSRIRRTIIRWPDSQEYMELAGWPDEYNAKLLNDDRSLSIYGSCAYSITKNQLKRAICDIMNKRSIERIELIRDGKYCEC